MIQVGFIVDPKEFLYAGEYNGKQQPPQFLEHWQQC